LVIRYLLWVHARYARHAADRRLPIQGFKVLGSKVEGI
jgi:hypothetical protein